MGAMGVAVSMFKTFARHHCALHQGFSGWSVEPARTMASASIQTLDFNCQSLASCWLVSFSAEAPVKASSVLSSAMVAQTFAWRCSSSDMLVGPIAIMWFALGYVLGRERNADQKVEKRPTLLRMVCNHDGFAAAVSHLPRRKADTPATSNAAAEASEPMDFIRVPKVQTPSVI